MIICEHEQGSELWHLDRLGIPTGSMFSKIITATGKPSTSADGYMNQLLADWEAGHPVDPFEPTQAMVNGTEREAQARDLYSFISDNEVEEVGFCFMDERKLIGVSPDGLVGDDGLVEIKSPKGATLMGYRRGGKLPSNYKAQVMGQLWVTDRQWCDFFVYHPDLNHFLIRVERDEKYIKTMEELMTEFIDKMLEQREIIKPTREKAA